MVSRKSNNNINPFRTVECQILDILDVNIEASCP